MSPPLTFFHFLYFIFLNKTFIQYYPAKIKQKYFQHSNKGLHKPLLLRTVLLLFAEQPLPS